MLKTSWLVMAVQRLFWASLAVALSPCVQARIQFDVFVGFENAVRPGSWYPVAIEVLNEDASFDGVIEISGSQFGGQVQRYAVELPSNTRKRLVIPVFASSASFAQVDARLLDTTGKVRDEKAAQRPKLSSWDNFILGAIPSQFAGMPAFPEPRGGKSDFAPQVARLMPEFLPDSPLLLEGLNALYLNSEKAVLLKEPQVEALLAWVNAGGHLIVAIEQPADLNTSAWLRDTIPARVGSLVTRKMKGELRQWLVRDDLDKPGQPNSRLRFAFEPPPAPGVVGPDAGERVSQFLRGEGLNDPAFDRAELPLVELRPDDRTVAFGPTNAPLIVSGPRGRGLVSVLAFNPERDPVKSWKARSWMWARLAGVPSELLVRDTGAPAYGGRMLDSIFGAMIETRQIRRLPKEALLVLLLVYLAVIGPVDQWWLKKINRPMLTWITFPAYVTLFSLLIYWIGFKLRAGSTEWNELHVVDVLPRGVGTELRGRAYAMVYSPANANYKLASDVRHSMLRSELGNLWAGAVNEARTSMRMGAKDGFQAEVYVPVWTSQMLVGDWHKDGPAPVKAQLSEASDGFTIRIENTTAKRFEKVWVVHQARIHDLGPLDPGEPRQLARRSDEGPVFRQWLDGYSGPFAMASVERQKMLGGNAGNHIDDWAGGCVAASFPGMLNRNTGEHRDYMAVPASDLTPLLERGETILLAWMPDSLVAPPMNQFAAVTSRKGTLFRLVAPHVKAAR